jgi:hypothetical protein
VNNPQILGADLPIKHKLEIEVDATHGNGIRAGLETVAGVIPQRLSSEGG